MRDQMGDADSWPSVRLGARVMRNTLGANVGGSPHDSHGVCHAIFGGIMRVAYTSAQGIIVELDSGGGYRVITNRGVVGPVLSSAASIAQHMPYTDWVEPSAAIDFDAWLAVHGLNRDVLQPDPETRTTDG